MNNYKELAVRYLKLNKRRSTLTIIGAALSVMVIFLALNLAWSYVLNKRERIREENDYEIIVLTETEEEIQEVLSDEKIKSASVGSYYYELYEEENEDGKLVSGKTFKNALYINTVNPYKMYSYWEYFEETYGITCVLNNDLAEYYFSDSGSFILVLAILMILITFIFATFGVGIVRNAIQLSTLEQIRDYGNLRCIGASKAELKTFIYIEGMILESVGIIAGLATGTIFSLIIGHFAGFSAGFHLIALIPILFCFYGDLYFAMQENAKLVIKITPIEAVRGEYKVSTDKLKVRRKSIFGRIFGVEGDYAYKNVMRNPDRFLKTVFTIFLGVMTAVTTLSVVLCIKDYQDTVKDMYQYYQVYLYSEDYIWYTSDDVQSLLPKEVLENLSDKEWVTEAKKMYRASVMLADYSDVYDHFSDEYISDTYEGYSYKAFWEKVMDMDEEERSTNYSNQFTDCISLTCYGYDEEDYARLDEALIDGTTDLSENGILIVNNVIAEALSTDYDGAGTEYIEREITTYKVGDTIDIVNMEHLRELAREKTDGALGSDEKYEILYDCWQQLLEEGDYQTYTVEGILEYDANHYKSSFMTVVLPLEKYYDFTGTNENMVYGMQYHVDDYSEEILNEWYEIEGEANDYWTCGDTSAAEFSTKTSDYMNDLYLVNEDSYMLIGALLFAVFIFLMNILNIFNTTAGNLYLRRREFAQLRVIGISKKGLMKMVMLEDVIACLFADITGVAAGIGMGYWISYYFYMLVGVTFSVMWLPIIIVCVASLLLLLSASYFPMKRLQPELIEDLTAGGE